MKRIILLFAALGLVAAACSGTNVGPEGPAAPDFTLALEPSGEFVLSQEVKPVYMVFWAEW